jgi:hypothetical protein
LAEQAVDNAIGLIKSRFFADRVAEWPSAEPRGRFLLTKWGQPLKYPVNLRGQQYKGAAHAQ